MYNVRHYNESWSGYREAVKAAREAFETAEKAARRYEGSPQAAKELEQARAVFKDALAAAVAEYAPQFNKTLSEMRDSAAKVKAAAPSEEQLRTLQMIQLRTNVTPDEAIAAAELVADNDLATATLEQLIATRGGVMPKTKNQHSQAEDAIRVLHDAASRLMLWDGRESTKLRNDYYGQKSQAQFAGGEPPSRDLLKAADVADVDARDVAADTVQAAYRAIKNEHLPSTVLDLID